MAAACAASQPAEPAPRALPPPTTRDAAEHGEAPVAIETEPAAPPPTLVASKAPLPRNCDGSEVPPPPLAKDQKVDPCYPPSEFVERLCGGTFPSVPLVMFAKGSPWRRGYLRFETKAWTTAPGGKNEKLMQDEEVLILQADASTSEGVQYDSGAAFYALRWDGTCVKMTQEELMQYVPWAKKTPLVEWQMLDDSQQAALRADPKVEEAYLASRKQCRSSSGRDARCEKLERRLSDLIVAHVREGQDQLPDPAHRP